MLRAVLRASLARPGAVVEHREDEEQADLRAAWIRSSHRARLFIARPAPGPEHVNARIGRHVEWVESTLYSQEKYCGDTA